MVGHSIAESFPVQVGLLLRDRSLILLDNCCPNGIFRSSMCGIWILVKGATQSELWSRSENRRSKERHKSPEFSFNGTNSPLNELECGDKTPIIF